MSGAQHTRGPWKLAGGFFAATVFVGDKKKPRIIHDGIQSDPEAVANARLIAAAPDLLAALRHLAECVDAERELSSASEIALDEARNAITKAEGRS